ncbi:MAG TPA: cytochrome c1 [Stellaceae bacterium]|nr:cytochrome c1 [Stellaceae bacterium]
MRKLVLAVAGAAALGLGAAWAQEASQPLPDEHWSFDGIFGTYDRAELQRGFQVYTQVCAACHALEHLLYADLGGPNGLGYSEAEVKAIAAQAQVTDGPNDQGEMFQRPGRPSDPFARPFANDKAARAANNGALPPDLSLIVKAREGGPQYVYGVLTGYREPPPGVKMGQGMNYNLQFPGHQIAMPQPLRDDSVTYADGTKATLQQEAHDVVAFLTWASEPTMEPRKRTGVKVFLFLLVATVCAYVVKRRIWASVH